MLDLIWRPDARAQAAAIVDYIAPRDAAAAQRLKDLIDERVALARVVPAMGRPGRLAGTRELVVHPNYVVVYRADDFAITVLRVLHSRQRYP